MTKAHSQISKMGDELGSLSTHRGMVATLSLTTHSRRKICQYRNLNWMMKHSVLSQRASGVMHREASMWMEATRKKNNKTTNHWFWQQKSHHFHNLLKTLLQPFPLITWMFALLWTHMAPVVHFCSICSPSYLCLLSQNIL